MSLRKCSVHIFESSAVLESPFSYIEFTQHPWGRDVKLHDKAVTSFATHDAQAQTFEHLFGIYDLPSGPHAALLMESEAFVNMKIPLINIRLAKKFQIIPLFRMGKALSASKQAEEKTCLELLQKAFSSHRFFYSPTGYDITMNQQNLYKSDNSKIDQQAPSWKKSDRRFFWNYDVLSDLMNIDAHSWIFPFMSAYIEFKPDLEIEDEKFSLLFISRRSCFRQGCRFTRRGIDSQGNCANFVETEQTLIHANGKISSYVQIRGSIPVIWKSPCSLKYDPVVDISSESLSCSSYCEDHFKSLHEQYCVDSRDSVILCVNLIDKKKDQQKLGIAYVSAVDSIKSRIASHIKYEWFDFHGETKKKGKWNNLSKLLVNVEDSFKTIGYFSRSPSGDLLSRQRGVIRTNCMDNLDRTNVTQSLFARRSLLAQLNKLDARANENVMDSPFKKFEKIYKTVWANNADAINLMYAGTGALKVDFTKTGKRTIKGMYNDGVNSIMRYYINNFQDGYKQDSIDAVLGKYKPTSIYAWNVKSEPLHCILYKLYALIVLLFSIIIIISRIDIGMATLYEVDTYHSLMLATVTSLLVFVYGFWVVFKHGSKIGERLVVRPRIVPLDSI